MSKSIAIASTSQGSGQVIPLPVEECNSQTFTSCTILLQTSSELVNHLGRPIEGNYA